MKDLTAGEWVRPVKFEKDDDSNRHIDFIKSAALSFFYIWKHHILNPDIKKRVLTVQPHLYGLRLINNHAI